MRAVLEHALATDQPITVPVDVVAEWWRGRTDLREAILASVDVEPLTTGLARIAGEAFAAVREATLVDAIVMASVSSGCERSSCLRQPVQNLETSFRP